MTARGLSLVALLLLTLGCSSCNRAKNLLPGSTSAESRQTSKADVPSNLPEGPKPPGDPPPKLAAGHPRLWIRAEDLPRLRKWAVASNPMYASGIGPLAEKAREAIDGGKVPAPGNCVHVGNDCETYALLMAFMSLVGPEGTRAADAERARKVLMAMMKRIDSGDEKDPLANKRFAVHNRSRWTGHAFGLTVDWIYQALSKEDKALIRKVFLRWSEQQLHAQTTSHNHPEPKGVVNDPALLQGAQKRRYAANNYFTAHMRNLVLMSLALDEAEDPADGTGTYKRLRDYLGNAIGAWLYMTDYALENDARGGASPEGFQYAARSLAYVMQVHLALHTAGQTDVKRYGSQVDYGSKRFFPQMIPAFLHAISPQRRASHRTKRPVFVPAWNGDAQQYELFEFIDVFGPMGLLAQYRGDTKTLNDTRWIQRHTAMGGPDQINWRASAHRGIFGFMQSIWYFLLYDPDAKPAPDPRQNMDLHFYGEGLGKIFARTSWGPEASWFWYQLSWAKVDHQHGDGNSFGWYRKGEWLTRERVGYGPFFEASHQHNTVSVENGKPNHHQDERRGGFWKTGSQWVLTHGEDPKVLAHSFGSDFVYVHGDATGLYNSSYENINDVSHVSRGLVWLKSRDIVVAYDRASTKVAGRFKRAWWHFEAVPKVVGQTAVAETPKGQKVHLQVLLPADAKLAASKHETQDKWQRKPAGGETFVGDLSVEPGKMPEDARFLTVLQASDGGPAVASATLRSSSGDQAVGARVGDQAVLFPVAPYTPLSSFEADVGSAKRVLVTGLKPGASYGLSFSGSTLKLTAGGSQKADSGGVISARK